MSFDMGHLTLDCVSSTKRGLVRDRAIIVCSKFGTCVYVLWIGEACVIELLQLEEMGGARVLV